MKKGLIRTLAVFSVWLLTAVAHAEVAIVVNGNVSVSSITAETAADIFLSKVNSLPDGTHLVPIDQEDSQKVRAEFYSKVVKKDAAQLNAYWSRLIFTGKGEPPKKVADNAEVLALVAVNPNIIGYVDAASVSNTAKVKVLLRIP